ncbi:MAG: deoxyribodipyrimidine photo-lyase, partial [Planctomycetota bacterium]
MVSEIPGLRIRQANDAEVRPDGEYVLYWMTAFRRTRYNFALERARNLALELNRPLVILEALRVGYRWASDRMHRFIIEGMRDNAAACSNRSVTYFPYVEKGRGQGKGLVHELAAEACVVVTDDYPCFFHPRMIKAVARSMPVPLEAVDSNCLMPLAYAERTFTVAHSYRRWMQKVLPSHLEDFPEVDPLDANLTELSSGQLDEIQSRWPAA